MTWKIVVCTRWRWCTRAYSVARTWRINFAEYAQALAMDILSSDESRDVPVRLQTELDPVVMSADLAGFAIDH